MRIHFTNELPESSIIHWHGLHVPVTADGHPRLAIDPGETYIYDFTVADRDGTYWYHPHPHGRTATQVYAGLAGLILIHDDEELNLGLPPVNMMCQLCFRIEGFSSDNQLSYNSGMMMDQMMGFLGNQLLINGMPDFSSADKNEPLSLAFVEWFQTRAFINWPGRIALL